MPARIALTRARREALSVALRIDGCVRGSEAVEPFGPCYDEGVCEEREDCRQRQEHRDAGHLFNEAGEHEAMLGPRRAQTREISMKSR